MVGRHIAATGLGPNPDPSLTAVAALRSVCLEVDAGHAHARRQRRPGRGMGHPSVARVGALCHVVDTAQAAVIFSAPGKDAVTVWQPPPLHYFHRKLLVPYCTDEGVFDPKVSMTAWTRKTEGPQQVRSPQYQSR